MKKIWKFFRTAYTVVIAVFLFAAVSDNLTGISVEKRKKGLDGLDAIDRLKALSM